MTTVLFNWRRSYALLLAATLGAVWAADYLFYGQPLGWAGSLFLAMLIAMIAIRSARFLRTWGGRVIALAALGLCFALVEEPTWLNLTYALLCIGTLAIINRDGWANNLPQWARRWARLLAGVTRIFSDNSIVMRWAARHGISPTIARGVFAWTLPLILGSVFVAIFAWANPIIADWVSNFGNWLSRLIERLPEILSVPRMLFWLGFAVVVWMLLRGRGRRLGAARAVAKPQAIIEPATDISPALVIRCLIVFNIIFIVQNVLDMRYLWNPHGLPKGMTYTQYVHRGAYPLIAAALLAGAFVLITFRPRAATERSPAARRLVYLWIAQTVLLTISAAWRLLRYVQMSQLTRLRVASGIWFALVAMGLIYIIWRIVRGRDNTWLVNVNAITALLALYPCCFINFDGIIAEFNIKHCREGGGPGSPLDFEYFRSLGPTTVTSLDSIRDRIVVLSRREQAQKVSADLHQQLADQLSTWRGWTWRRQRTSDAIHTFDLARSKSQQLFAAR
jgi:hypothetical protein